MGTYKKMVEAKTDEELIEDLEGYRADSVPGVQIRMELTRRHFSHLADAINKAGRSAEQLSRVGILIAIVGVILAFVSVLQTCVFRE